MRIDVQLKLGADLILMLLLLIFLLRFTAILGDKRYSTEEPARKSNRLSSPPPKSSSIYPDVCQICGKFRKQHKNKRYTPYVIESFNAEYAIKSAYKTKNPTLYNEIESLDLIAKEFKVHQPCYQKLTFGHSSSSSGKDNASNEATACYSKSNYEEVKEYINDVVIKEKRPASMKLLHEIYGLGVGDTSYRNKMKIRLEKDFGEEITFLSPKNKALPEIVISSEYFSAETVLYSDEQTIKNAARILRNDTLKKFESFSWKMWPPNVEELCMAELKPPESVTLFVRSILRPTGDRTPNVDRIIDSISQDIVFNILGRKIIQQKHFLLGLGLHSLTASRKVIDILYKFGHSVSYNYVCDVETAYAEVAQENAKKGLTLPLQPKSPSKTVFTHFWVDNFDVLVDRQAGGGSVNTTHLVAFQNPSEESILNHNQLSISRRKSRKIFIEDLNITSISITKKKGPPSTFNSPKQSVSTEDRFNRWFLLWLYLRKAYSYDQLVPIFKGFKLQSRKMSSPEVVKAIETYLPPIDAKVTDYQTIQKYLQSLQDLAEQANMPFVNVTLDVGAAMNAFLVTWNDSTKFDKVIIHLGSFHFLKENFQVQVNLMIRL